MEHKLWRLSVYFRRQRLYFPGHYHFSGNNYWAQSVKIISLLRHIPQAEFSEFHLAELYQECPRTRKCHYFMSFDF